MILLTGATGNNGAETARQLIALGARVRAMAVHPDKTRALWSAASIKAENAFSLPLSEARIGVIDTGDIAAVAARVLTEEGHAGRVYDLTGPQALSYSEVAHTLSEVLGRPMDYRPNTASDRRLELLAQGMPESYVDAELDLADALIAGIGNKVSTAVEEITGTRPRDVATFARDFAPAFA